MKKRDIVKAKDLALLDAIEDYQAEHGYSPTIRELLPLAGTTSTSVANYYLGRLERLGLIEREPRISRGIRLLDKNAMKDPKSLPLVGLKPVPLAKRRFRSGIALAGALVRQARSRQALPQ